MFNVLYMHTFVCVLNDLVFFFCNVIGQEAQKGIVASVVTSHVSPWNMPHGDTAPNGIAPLSINRRRRGVEGWGGG